MKKETAKKAAKWWADQLRGHAKEQVNLFEKCLADILIKENPKWGFGVDCNPDAILEYAAYQAGLVLGMTTLPWKTMMRIDNDKITVRGIWC